MRRIFLTLCAVLICFRFSIAQEKDTHAKNALHVSPQGKEDDIRGAQDALIAAYIHRDTAALDRILAGEYTFSTMMQAGWRTKNRFSTASRQEGIERLRPILVRTIRCACTEMSPF